MSKGTTGGRINGGRNITLDGDLFSSETWVGIRYGGNQGLCVGMPWITVNLVGSGQFDDLAKIHDSNSVLDMSDHCQVVGNEHECELPATLDIHE